ncbi:MAG: hypothetical protein AAFV01_06345 [Bacteroidota bacterium]
MSPQLRDYHDALTREIELAVQLHQVLADMEDAQVGQVPALEATARALVGALDEVARIRRTHADTWLRFHHNTRRVKRLAR